MVTVDGTVVSASMRNHHLGQAKDALAALNTYFLAKDETLYEAYAELQILPTYAEIDEEGQLALGYGTESLVTENTGRSYKYPLLIEFDSELRIRHVERDG